MAETIFQDLESKFGKEKSFNLLYKGTNSVDVEEFHMKCDGKGPTVTILYGKYNTIFGGYTSESWSCGNKKTKPDETAFLFYKKDNETANCMIIPIKESCVDKAITCDEKYGPTFGVGSSPWNRFDLQTFRKDRSKKEFEIKDKHLHLNGRISIGHSYDIDNLQPANAVNDIGQANDVDTLQPTANFTPRTRKARVPQDEPNENEDKSVKSDINALTLAIKRIEVYQVVVDVIWTLVKTIRPVSVYTRLCCETVETEKEWRKKPKEDETETMKKNLETFEPVPGLGLQYHNILLIGAIGSGKSSFFNTLATVFEGEVKTIAIARYSTTSVTNEVHAYVLKSKKEKTVKEMKLQFFDIRGFQDQRGYDHELHLLLDGKLPTGYVFPEQSKPVKEEDLVNASLENQIHLVVFVTGTSYLNLMTGNLHQRIEDIQKQINMKGLPMVVVATRFDELCPKIRLDPDRIYKSNRARNATNMISNFFGIHEKHIFPVVNYTNDEKINSGKDRLALQALDIMAKLTKDYLENHKAKKSDAWSQRAHKLRLLKDEHETKVTVTKLVEKLSGLNEKELRVLCVGNVCSGKSSFIDSLASTLRGKIYSKASGQCATGDNSDNPDSMTEKFQMYQMKCKQGSGEMKASNIYIGDIPGFQEVEGISLQDVKYVIQGHVPDKYKIIKGIDKDDKKFKRQPQMKDSIHCVCFVFDMSTHPEKIQVHEKFQLLQKWLCQNGIPFVLILTKGDLLVDAVRASKLCMLEKTLITERMDKLKKMFNVKQKNIFPVINYIHEEDVDPESDILLLAALKEITELGIEYLEEHKDGDSDESDD